jgi:hypothetical protein
MGSCLSSSNEARSHSKTDSPETSPASRTHNHRPIKIEVRRPVFSPLEDHSTSSSSARHPCRWTHYIPPLTNKASHRLQVHNAVISASVLVSRTAEAFTTATSMALFCVASIPVDGGLALLRIRTDEPADSQQKSDSSPTNKSEEQPSALCSIVQRVHGLLRPIERTVAILHKLAAGCRCDQ